MSQYYNAQRSRNLYVPGAVEPYRISRSKIDAFLNCPRCFYFDRRLGTGQPPGYPFTLNSAVDALLKKEFDRHRAAGTSHPIQAEIDPTLIPAPHPQIDVWRENFKGVQTFHEPTNLTVTGAIDDLWIDGGGRYYVVDYKATAKSTPVTQLDQDWHAGYKRQMEIYQWLLRRNDLEVSDIAYFVYCTGRVDAQGFNQRIEFDVTVIPYRGNANWIDETLLALHACLNSSALPPASADCDYCAYRNAIDTHLNNTGL